MHETKDSVNTFEMLRNPKIDKEEKRKKSSGAKIQRLEYEVKHVRS